MWTGDWEFFPQHSQTLRAFRELVWSQIRVSRIDFSECRAHERLCWINRASFLDWWLKGTSGGWMNVHLLMEHDACQKAKPRQSYVSGREWGESKMELIMAIKILINPRGLSAFCNRSGKEGSDSTPRR